MRQFLQATRNARTLITDPRALYYGMVVNDQSVTPADRPRLGRTRFEDWLRHKGAGRFALPISFSLQFSFQIS